jgi:hypothetical protein
VTNGGIPANRHVVSSLRACLGLPLRQHPHAVEAPRPVCYVSPMLDAVIRADEELKRLAAAAFDEAGIDLTQIDIIRRSPLKI